MIFVFFRLTLIPYDKISSQVKAFLFFYLSNQITLFRYNVPILRLVNVS